jgi:hypothetical protein
VRRRDPPSPLHLKPERTQSKKRSRKRSSQRIRTESRGSKCDHTQPRCTEARTRSERSWVPGRRTCRDDNRSTTCRPCLCRSRGPQTRACRRSETCGSRPGRWPRSGTRSSRHRRPVVSTAGAVVALRAATRAAARVPLVLDAPAPVLARVSLAGGNYHAVQHVSARDVHDVPAPVDAVFISARKGLGDGRVGEGLRVAV